MLRGDLAVFPFMPVMQMLLSSGRAGRLSVSHARGGELWFEPGELVHARAGSLTGKNLMHLARGQELEAYEPTTLGEFVSLGGLMAVGWMKLPWNQKLAITGGLAHVMKKASEWRWRASID